MSEKNIDQEETNGPGVAADYSPLGTNMEFEDLTLPRDRFTRFRHFLLAHPLFRYNFFSTLWSIGFCLFWFISSLSRKDNYSIFMCAFFVIVTPIEMFFLRAAPDIDETYARTGNSASFLGEVVKFRPGLDMSKWDLIAARMNRIFHYNDNKITPYFFYDGSDCYSHFIKWYITGNRSVHMQPMINEAVKVFNESVEEYWRQHKAQASEKSELSEKHNINNDSEKNQAAS